MKTAAIRIVVSAALLGLASIAWAQTPPAKDEKKDEKKKSAPKAPAKAPAKPTKAPPKSEKKTVRIYGPGEKAPVLRDKDGNVIPTNPEAYNVDSAIKPKPR